MRRKTRKTGYGKENKTTRIGNKEEKEEEEKKQKTNHRIVAEKEGQKQNRRRRRRIEIRKAKKEKGKPVQEKADCVNSSKSKHLRGP
jgi:hypothetical protein